MNKLLIAAIKKLLPLAVALCLWLPGVSIAEENMCTNLKKVNNLDELLYQIYINLDSDCLFTMPLAELEKAWGFKILSQESLQPGQRLFELREGADFAGKPYQSEADAFYVEADQWDEKTTGFTIYITKAYDEKYATLFPEGNYPRLLPDPIEKFYIPHLSLPAPYDEQLRYPKNPGNYSGEIHYYWLSLNRTRMILLSPELTKSVGSIVIIDGIAPGLSNDIIK